MSPIGAVIFSILIMSGIMTAGGIHAKYGIPLWLWIGANGALTGYGGGLWRKKWLLEHEEKHNDN